MPITHIIAIIGLYRTLKPHFQEVISDAVNQVQLNEGKELGSTLVETTKYLARFVKDREFLGKLSDHKLPKKNCVYGKYLFNPLNTELNPICQ